MVGEKNFEKYSGKIQNGDNPPKKVAMFEDADKVVSDVVEKFYKGEKLSAIEAKFLLSYAISHSSLYEHVRDSGTHIEIKSQEEMKGTANGKTVNNSDGKKSVYLSEELIGKEMLFSMLSVLFHEFTHVKQDVSEGDRTKRVDGEVANRLNPDAFDAIIKTIQAGSLLDKENGGLSEEEVMTTDEISEANQGYYVSKPKEREAREQGPALAEIFLESLLQNKYIQSKGLKEFIERDLQLLKETRDAEITRDSAYIKQYERLKNNIQNRFTVFDIMDGLDNNDIQGMASTKEVIFDWWIENKNPEDLAVAYLAVLSDGPSFFRERLVGKINDSRFPEEEREFLKKEVKKILANNSSDEFYEYELNDLLSKEEILEVYVNLLETGQHEKLALPLFDNIKESTQGRNEVAHAILDAMDNGHVSKYLVEEIKSVKFCGDADLRATLYNRCKSLYGEYVEKVQPTEEENKIVSTKR